MDLSKERSLILEMISEGKISVDEGEELLQALNASTKKKTVTYVDDIEQEPQDEFFPKIPPIPAIPPIPGTKITQPTKQELETIFSSQKGGWAKIGNLLRNKSIEAKVNLDKIVSRHLGILAMTAFVSVLITQIVLFPLLAT